MKEAEDYAQRLRTARKDVAGLTQSEAESYLKSCGLRVSARSLSKWENGKGPPEQVDGDEVISVLESYDQGSLENASGRDPIYPAVASAGDGSFDMGEDPIGYIEGENALSRPGRDIFWMPVRGDSMGDTLPKGGLVPVQKFDPTWTELREDDVYLFRLEGAIQIKRLQRRPGARIRVVSDNSRYDDFSIALDDGVDFEILGRVLV